MSRASLALLFVCLGLANGCSEPADDLTDTRSEILSLISAGELVRAEHRCKEAIRGDPANPSLRILYGDIFLAVGEGRNAEIAFRKAVELGVDSAEIQTRLARALLLQKRFADVVDFDDMGSALNEQQRSELAIIRLRAALQLPGGDEFNLHRTARNLISLLDDRADEDSWARSLRDELQMLAYDSAVVASAYEHARCRLSSAKGYVAKTVSELSDGVNSVIRVGPTRRIKTPAGAADVAEDGSLILIDAGKYSGGVARWMQNDISIIGVGGRPQIEAAGQAIDGRDIWLFSGDDVLVENVEFSGAKSKTHRNGAGIRHMGSNLTVRHSYFRDSDNGILTWKAPNGEVLVEYSEFARNGFGDGQSHNLYIGESELLTFRFNYTHASNDGHLLKSRARVNDVRYNRMTGEGGTVSYVVDVPNGGVSYIIGNEIEKAVNSRNPYVISFGQEGLKFDENRLIVAYNSVYNRYDKTILVRNVAKAPALIVNNLIGGAPMGMVTGTHLADGNQSFPDHGMVNPREYNFSLTDDAGAIDNGIDLGVYSAGEPVTPDAEYMHPVSMRPRIAVATFDVGAKEYCAQ